MAINVKEHGAKGDGFTDDTAAIQASVGLAATGETVFFPTGNYLIDCTSPIALAKDVQIRGEGVDAVSLTCSNASSTSPLMMFVPGEGAEVSFVDLTMVGPGSIGTGGRFDAVYVNKGKGTVSAHRCRFNGFTTALRVSSSEPVNWQGALEASECQFVGYGSTGTKRSTPILVNHQGEGARGRRVRVFDCDFEGFGDSATSLDHGMYISTDWEVEIAECRFLTSVGGGFAIQLFDEGVSAANRGSFQVIRNCHFSSALSVRGVVAGRVSTPLIEGCTFENEQPAIVCAGGTPTVCQSNFLGILGKEDAVIETQTAPMVDVPITFESNDFIGNAGLVAFIGDSGDYVFSANRFAAEECGGYLFIQGGSPTVRILANDLRGKTSGALITVKTSASLHVLGNTFLSSGGNCVSLESEAATAIITGNDFSQSAGTSVVSPKIPSTYRCVDNTGSNVGIASFASASTVTLPEVGVVFAVTGKTEIKTITASFAGRLIVLKFAETLKVATSGNLKLSAATLEPNLDDTLSLVSDGTHWYETAFSVNN